MDDLPNQTSTTPDLADLHEQVDSLQHLVVSILVLVLVISGTLWIFLRRQVNSTKSELDALRPTATNVIAQYDKVTGPAMDNFVGRLVEYSRSHPDFAPVLAKYGIKPGPASAPTSSPLPPGATLPPAPQKK